MNILFHDLIQYSNAPETMKNPALTSSMANQSTTDEYIDGGTANSSFDETYDNGDASAVFDGILDGGHSFITKEFAIVLKEPSTINCYGVGNTDSKSTGVYLIDTSNNIFFEAYPFTRNGLFKLEKDYENIKQINLVFSGAYIGRVGAGYGINLKTAVPKEPTLISTAGPRVTLSGQSILGLGGYTYWQISVDTRYKIDKDKFDNIIQGYKLLSNGYPMFISFDDESKLPIDRMYGVDTSQQELGFESSINKPLYSRRFIFEERF